MKGIKRTEPVPVVYRTSNGVSIPVNQLEEFASVTSGGPNSQY